MIISYSAAAQSALRRTVVYLMDGGSDAGTINVYGGTKPPSPDFACRRATAAGDA